MHPHRGRYRHRRSVGVERLLHNVVDTVAGSHRRIVAVEVGQQDHELVASEASHGVVRPHDRAQPVGDLADDVVAPGMAEFVVDRLEAIEVDEQEADVGAVAS